MNFASNDSMDPNDDTFHKEDISPTRETLLRRLECLHTFEEEENGLLACRLCGHRERLDESPTDYSDSGDDDPHQDPGGEFVVLRDQDERPLSRLPGVRREGSLARRDSIHNLSERRVMEWIKFFPAHFEIGTRHLSAEEVGCYIRLLCAQALTGDLPVEFDRLSRIAGGMSPEVWEAIEDKFPVVDGVVGTNACTRRRAKPSRHERPHGSPDGRVDSPERRRRRRPQATLQATLQGFLNRKKESKKERKRRRTLTTRRTNSSHGRRH